MRLTVLYDEGCPMCRRFQQWLANQPLLVPTNFVAAGSPRGRDRYPALDRAHPRGDHGHRRRRRNLDKRTRVGHVSVGDRATSGAGRTTGQTCLATAGPGRGAHRPASDPAPEPRCQEATTLTTVPEPATGSAKAEQTRQAIVEAALRLFRSGGYDKTTMRAIAGEADVSLGNAYYTSPPRNT